MLEVFGEDVGEDEFAGDGLAGLGAVAEEGLGDLGAEAFELGLVVEAFAVAGAGEVDGDGGVEGGAGAEGEGDDAVGEVEGLVDGVGDEDDGLFVLLPDVGDLVLEGGAGEGVEGGVARVRATETRWRMPPESWRGRRSLAWESFTMAMYLSTWAARSAGLWPGKTDSTAREMFSSTVSQGRRE